MKTFLYRTHIKVICGVLSTVLLSAAGLCFALIVWMAASGAYSGNLFDTLLIRQMSQDADRVMDDYFDPFDPTGPMPGADTGDIFTGDQTNFRYTVTDSSGLPVLSTWNGEDWMYTLDFGPYIFSLTETADTSEAAWLEDDMFLCGGVWFRLSSDGSSFYPAEAPSRAGDYASFDSDTYDFGLVYSENGEYYTFDGVGFRLTDTETVTDTAWYITTGLLRGLPWADNYRLLNGFCGVLERLRYILAGAGAAAFLAGMVLLGIVCRTVGRKGSREAAAAGPGFRIPWDLSLCVCAALCIVLGAAEFVFVWDRAGSAEMFRWFPLLGILMLCAAGTGVYLILNLCVRYKTRTMASGSLLMRLGRLFRRCFGIFLRHLTLLWKVIPVFLAVCLAELLLLWLIEGLDVWLVLLWLAANLVLGALILYVTLAFQHLKRGAEAIAAGDYTAKVSGDYLVADLKDMADTLNHIGDGMNTAVETRLRSERMKTELITNVSHDLKTPLTSIVTYVDLLKQEPQRSDAAREYLRVLDRQSMRLKKLIEDLVELSKAATGNLNPDCVPLDFTMLLRQAMGEYSIRITDAGLKPVIRMPDEPVMISADGQLLWRVLDNLLGNAVKYAMPGTRLYVTVEAGPTVSAVFSNISREELNITAEELLERFVRGDVSRHTEGSGLGLSIAQSLTESMGGTFALSIEGDLFRAAVTFPVLSPDGSET